MTRDQRILEKDREFLGMTEHRYYQAIRRAPNAFPVEVVKAFERHTGEWITITPINPRTK